MSDALRQQQPAAEAEAEAAAVDADPTQIAIAIDDNKPTASYCKDAAAKTATTTTATAAAADDQCEGVKKSAVGSFADSESDRDVYHVKWIRYRGQSLPIVTQNVNGPCPLLAIANTLLLRGSLQLPNQCACVTSHHLTTRLGETLMEIVAGQSIARAAQRGASASGAGGESAAAAGGGANLDQIVSDSLSLFPKLQTGLDINIRFSGCSEFEYTPELDMFDQYGIDLVHGWVLDPQQRDVSEFIGSLTYNQLVEKIITAKSDEDQNCLAQALAAEDFLEFSCNQLTVCGLMQLAETVQEDALCVLFRNNHFSTLTKHQNRLYVLVTDQGFLHQPDVAWETLANVDNDSSFVNAEFAPAEIEPTAGYPTGALTGDTAEQVERDRQLAFALQNQSAISGVGGGAVHHSAYTDEQLAMQLQREEEELYQRQQQQRQPQHRQPTYPQHQHQHQRQQQQQQHRVGGAVAAHAQPGAAAGGADVEPNRRSSSGGCACL